jgi:glycosyltransferase involved in cell wall biosynthesis
MAERPAVLVAGLEQAIPKIARHYQMLQETADCRVTVYSRDPRGLSGTFCQAAGVAWEAVPGGKAADLMRFARLCRRLRPCHAELYFGTPTHLVFLGYVLIAWLLHIPIVFVCRGGELLYWNSRHDWRSRLSVCTGLKMARLVLYKELHMPQRLQQLRVPKSRTVFFHNRIPFSPLTPPATDLRHGVLFLNSWKQFRRPDIAVEVALRLAKDNAEFRFTIAGERKSDRGMCGPKITKAEYERKIGKADLASRVQLLPWQDDADSLFRTHCIFLLPSDLVFLNYSLLEAMERGLVPIIAKTDGSDLIVNHGEDGLIVDLTPEAFTEAVGALLHDEARLARMANAARQKVKTHFDLHVGLAEIVRTYRTRGLCLP